MILAIDIGNSNVVIGVFNNEKLIQSWRLRTRFHQSIDEYEMLRISDTKPDVKGSLINNDTIFNQLLHELEHCLKEFSEIKKIAGNKKIIDGRSALLKEWLERSRAKGRKVCSLYNNNVQRNSKGELGIIEGLTSEGYLQIRTESGNILTHFSGDIIDLSD